jgi:hypothetical protein
MIHHNPHRAFQQPMSKHNQKKLCNHLERLIWYGWQFQFDHLNYYHYIVSMLQHYNKLNHQHLPTHRRH